MPMVCCQIKGYGVLWNLYLLCVRKGFKPNSNKRAIKLEPSPTNNHVLERPTNCDARGSILCATKLWRHSKWRWKDERPADRTKKHGSAFACVHRTPTRSQVAQEIRKRSSFVERKNSIFKVLHEKISFHYHNDPFVGRKVVKGTAKLKKRTRVHHQR